MPPRLASRTRALAAISLFGLIVATSADRLSAQPAPAAKKVLTFADYDVWRSTSGVALSRDGQHIAYVVGSESAEGEAVVRHVPSGKEYRFPPEAAAAFGGIPKFTPDSKLALLPLTPSKAALKKAKADEAKWEDTPKAGLALVDLASGKELDRIKDVGSYQVAGEGAGFLLYRHQSPPDEEKSDGSTPKGGKTAGKGVGGKTGGKGGPGGGTAAAKTNYGTDLLIRDLTGTSDRVIPEVTQFGLTNDEKLLVYVVSGKDESKNGVYAMNPRFGTAATRLKVGAGRYSGLTWDETQTKLAFYYDDSQVPSANVAPPPHVVGGKTGSGVATAPPPSPPKWRVFVWDRNAKTDPMQISRVPVVPAGAGLASVVAPVLTAAAAPSVPTSAMTEVYNPDMPGMKPGWSLTGNALSFSQDGTKLYVSTAPERPRTTATPAADDVQLDIWHWKDAATPTAQKLRAAQDRNKSYGAVLLLDSKQFRQLSSDEISVGQPGTGDWAVGSDDRKYRHMTGYAWPVPSDYSLVNVRTGETKALLTASGYGVNLSPDGKYLLGFDNKDWFTVSVPGGTKTNLTSKLKEKFFNEEHDTPSDPPPYGGGQWTPDGKFVLVSDRFDVWKLAADGSSAENLTKIGRSQNVSFTILRPRSPDDRVQTDRHVDLSKPLLLGAENLLTRDSGFYRLEPGSAPKMLLMGARAYNYFQYPNANWTQVAPVKAKDADVYLLTVQTFSRYPDYYVTTSDFHELKRVTDLNPQTKNYNWGTAELIHYTSTDGEKLSGVLVKPENFDPTKKYPMVVYIYERLSENLHHFREPNVTRGQIINPTFYASNGYLVLMPDIAYKVGTPGQSALRCVLPAIQAVADKGFVDEKAIGINGQSWGGYQIAYMVTQTNRFKAAVAGAPVANMTSAYSGIRWGSGLPRQFQYEKTQSRIGATLWEAPMKYLENSPVFMADRVQTPLLMIHNDQDDAVPWYQGIEYFLALRRLGKEAYLLNYNGEPHNLARRAPARDFSVRMFQFFEHHLRGKPAPEWMEKGVPFIDREKEKEQIKKVLGGK